jgi:integrase/recombinase XerD
VAKPKVPARAPKALQGEGTPERLLQAVAAGERPARDPWPERDLAFIATALLTGLRLSELLSLDLGSIDGREGERRLKVTGKGSKVRFVPIAAPGARNQQVPRHPAWRTTSRGSSPPPLPYSSIATANGSGVEEPSTSSAGPTAGPVWVAESPKGALVHALRHTMATRLAEDGASASQIQHILATTENMTSPPTRRESPPRQVQSVSRLDLREGSKRAARREAVCKSRSTVGDLWQERWPQLRGVPRAGFSYRTTC